MRENDIRDYLFEKHKTSLSSLVRSRVKPVATAKEAFPRISELLCARTEAKIDAMVEQLELLTLQGKEVRLVRDDDSSTRIDLLGHLEGYGHLVIIELKKSGQTERQSFTELLAYANHFCTLFPSLSETSFMSVLIAPMQGRGVRDALAQELIVNGKNTLGLIPTFDGDTLTLTPYYPSDQYYRWIENSIVDDNAFSVVAATFQIIKGWIDAGAAGTYTQPDYTINAFEIMTSIISQKVEALRLHGFVYARQYWSETCPAFPEPNAIILCLLNPFKTSRTDTLEGKVFDQSDEARLKNLQSLIDQLDDNEFWLDNLCSSFADQAIRIMQESFKEFFATRSEICVRPSFSLPDWGSFKTNMVESVICHNTNIRVMGMLRTIHSEYMRFCRDRGRDEIYYSDDLPMFGYLDHEDFLAIWEIFRGLSTNDDDS